MAERPTVRFASLNWVIAGGESGPQARPTHPNWFRSLRRQRAEAGTDLLHERRRSCPAPTHGPGARGHHRATTATHPAGRSHRRCVAWCVLIRPSTVHCTAQHMVRTPRAAAARTTAAD
ncbi:DUF5131 family protein [Streptomyces sp. NPDC002758]